MANFNGMAALETPEFMVSKMDDFGSPDSYNHYSVGWAWAMNAPFQWTKQVASHWGGTRNGTIVHWPAKIAEPGWPALPVHPRHRPRPDDLGGSGAAGADHGQRGPAVAHRGHEHALLLRGGGGASERRDLQYFEMLGNRGIYHRGWSAVTKHKTPWIMVGGDVPAFDDDVWELYDGELRLQPVPEPGRGGPATAGCAAAAVADRGDQHNVLPLDDRTGERLEPSIAGRPTLVHGSSPLFFSGMGRLSENSVVSMKNKSFSITADVDVPAGGVNGVIIAQGGRLADGRSTSRAGGSRSSTTCSASGSSPPLPTTRSPTAGTSCGWSSHTTAAGSPRPAA